MKSPKAMTSGTRKRGNQLTNWLCVSIDSTGKSWRKRQTTLDGYVAGLTSKRPHIWDFSWAAARNRSLGLSTKILKVIWRLTGFSQYTIQMVLTTHCSFKAMSLKMAPTAGTMGRMYVPTIGHRVGVTDCLGSAFDPPVVMSSPWLPLTVIQAT